MTQPTPTLTRTVIPNAKKIDSLRLHKGWTAEQFADAAGVSDRTVRSVLQGKRVYPSTLKCLAVALEVEMTELFSHLEAAPNNPSRLPQRFEVIVTLEGDRTQFNESDFPTLIELFAMALKSKDGIEVIAIRHGSTQLVLSMTETDIIEIAKIHPNIRKEWYNTIQSSEYLHHFGVGRYHSAEEIEHPIDRAAFIEANYLWHAMLHTLSRITTIEMPSDEAFDHPRLRGRIYRFLIA